MTGRIFHLIAHTHWDREWYLPQAAFLARLVPVVDDLIARLQAEPAYRAFLLDGQTVLLEDFLRVRPDRDAEVRTLVRTGRLQVGPWYVLADELIPSGEALVRNLLLGAADAARWGGRSDVLYSPDTFGHPAALPTLAREFALRFAVLWRGLGGEPGQERDLYSWRGPDGREVLLWHMPPPGYEIGAALTADPARLAVQWPLVRDVLVARAASKHIPIFVGADHHAAPPDLVRLRDMLAELEPGDAFRVSRLDEFFQGAEAAPTTPLSGELRWSYRAAWTLQGVHGTRAPLKRRNSDLELWLERFAEPLAALSRRSSGRDRQPLLDHAWRTLIRTQFHDCLAGTASDAVAQAVMVRQTAVEALAREITRGSIRDLVHHDADTARASGSNANPTLVLWNPAARQRAGAVVIADVTLFRRDVFVGPPSGRKPREAEARPPRALRAPDGTVYPVQLLDETSALERIEASQHYPDQDEVLRARIALRAPPLGGLGLATLTVAGAKDQSSEKALGEGVLLRGRSLVNAAVEVTVESSGTLAIRDRKTGERFAGLLRIASERDAGDAYTYAPGNGPPVSVKPPIRVRPLAEGPLVGALEVRAALPGRARTRLIVMLHADDSLVRCVLEIENQAPNHRLRAWLPTGIDGRAERVVAGTAFGSVERGVVAISDADYPLETPVRTAPAQRFVGVARGSRGLALFAPGFFEYEWTGQGDLAFTLLRAIGQLSIADLPTRPGHAAWPTAIPQAQHFGVTRVELAIAPISVTDVGRGDVLPALWEDGFLPIRGFWLRDALTVAPAAIDIRLEGAGLVLSAVKPAQLGSPMVLRCYNATGRKTVGAWHFGDGTGSVRSAHRVRADERESTPLALEGRGKTIRFAVEPYEIVTILVS